jgi:thiol:disulfide interchange protein
MLRNTVRGVLGLVLVAVATWLANYVTELIFGPEETGTRA